MTTHNFPAHTGIECQQMHEVQQREVKNKLHTRGYGQRNKVVTAEQLQRLEEEPRATDNEAVTRPGKMGGHQRDFPQHPHAGLERQQIRQVQQSQQYRKGRQRIRRDQTTTSRIHEHGYQ